MGQTKIVEINGRKYDAASGELIKQSAKKTNSGGHIDGVRKAKPAKQLHSTTKKTRTLNRAAVKKPAEKTKASDSSKITRSSQAKSHVKKVDTSRQSRSSKVAKSSLVTKFSKAAATSKPKPQSATEKSPPKPHTPPATKAQELAATNKPAKSTNPDKKKAKKNRNWSLKKPKSKSVFATVTIGFLLLAYITYLNIPNLSLRIAASRAGIEATLPGYKPSGFGMAGPINYSDGIVTLNFSSNTDERYFNIIERESSWDSKSLLANFVERETPNYVTFQDRGLTIYIYDGSQATWVDSGIWYTIEGESQLNSEQLLKIAASM